MHRHCKSSKKNPIFFLKIVHISNSYYFKHWNSPMTKKHDSWSRIWWSSCECSLLFFLKVCKSPKFKIWHLQSVNIFYYLIQILSSWQWNQNIRHIMSVDCELRKTILFVVKSMKSQSSPLQPRPIAVICVYFKIVQFTQRKKDCLNVWNHTQK